MADIAIRAFGDESPPDEVVRLVRERAEARRARDWARADELRERIRQMRWEVRDVPGGVELIDRRPWRPRSAASSRPAPRSEGGFFDQLIEEARRAREQEEANGVQ